MCVFIIYMLRRASSLSSFIIRDTVLLVCVVKVRIVFTICNFFSQNAFNANLSFSLTLHTYTNLQDVPNSLIKSWLRTLILCCKWPRERNAIVESYGVIQSEQHNNKTKNNILQRACHISWSSVTTKHADSYDRPHAGLELNPLAEMEHETSNNSANLVVPDGLHLLCALALIHCLQLHFQLNFLIVSLTLSPYLCMVGGIFWDVPSSCTTKYIVLGIVCLLIYSAGLKPWKTYFHHDYKAIQLEIRECLEIQKVI